MLDARLACTSTCVALNKQNLSNSDSNQFASAEPCMILLTVHLFFGKQLPTSSWKVSGKVAFAAHLSFFVINAIMW